MYNEAKYLEPPIPFQSFVRYVSKHLPREAQVTLMTKEIENLSELERILDILQSIRDSEIIRRPIQTNQQNNNIEFSRHRSSYQGNGEHHNNYRPRNHFQQTGEWNCSRCGRENYANQQQCFRCRQPKEEQKRREQMKQHIPNDKGGPGTSGTSNHRQGRPNGQQQQEMSNGR